MPRMDIALRMNTLATHLIYQSKVYLGVTDSTSYFSMKVSPYSIDPCVGYAGHDCSNGCTYRKRRVPFQHLKEYKQ